MDLTYREISTVLNFLASNVSKYDLSGQLQNLRTFLKARRPPGVAIPQVVPSLENIQRILLEFVPQTYIPHYGEIIERLRVDKVVGLAAADSISKIIQSIINGSTDSEDYLSHFVGELQILVHDIPRAYKTLSPLHELEDDRTDYECVIEIIFEENASIDNFAQAKVEMQDWNLIIKGVAELSNLNVQEFEIIGFSKNSPTRAQVATTIGAGLIFINLFTNVLDFSTKLIEYKTASETMKSLDNTWVDIIDKKVEEHVKKTIGEQKQRISKEAMQQNNSDPGIQNSVEKSIEKQYKFINNGGTVNIYLNAGDGQQNNSVQLLEEKQSKVKELLHHQPQGEISEKSSYIDDNDNSDDPEVLED